MKMQAEDIDAALSGLTALRVALCDELERTECHIRLVAACTMSSSPDEEDGEQLTVYDAAAIQLRSGIASLDEVLGWVYFGVAEERPEQPHCPTSLPRLYLVPKTI